jgi:hypothetical protein
VIVNMCLNVDNVTKFNSFISKSMNKNLKTRS